MSVDLMKAMGAFRRSDYQTARTLFAKHLAEYSEDAVAHAHLAFCLLALKQPFSALEQSNRALRADPELGLAHLAKAQVSSALDDPATSKAALAEALRLDPENVDALLIKCSTAMFERDYAGVEAAALALLAKQPDSFMGHYFLSRAASSMLKGQKAETAARDALRLQPDDSSAHEAIGWAFWAQNRMDKARQAALSTLALDADDQGAHKLLAAVEMQSRPLTGGFHRFGMAANELSIKKAVYYVAPAFFLYFVAYDIMRFLDYDDAARIINRIVIVLSVLVWLSVNSFNKKAVRNRQAAKLRYDY
ncbi:tetratricopeptide repeat protein [Yoonia sp. SDW83-1]|uniref:tetratricopeptide repeat protein n=1 Tax=Yoonia sp. SDW83-1 TaxID=3366945 RepID=UPI00398C7099